MAIDKWEAVPTIALWVFALLVLGIQFFAVKPGFSQANGLNGITTFMGLPMEEERREQRIGVVVPPITSIATSALFDIVLTVPKKSQQIREGDDLLIAVELLNFGSSGPTPVSISYIVTNSEGDVVLLEHDDRIVETQQSFIRDIGMSRVKSHGNHKLFVEMLYSDTSATATGEFYVS